jgi:hypothetical protein
MALSENDAHVHDKRAPSSLRAHEFALLRPTVSRTGPRVESLASKLATEVC